MNEPNQNKEPKYIYIYETIEPTIISKHADLIGNILFGFNTGITKNYSFLVNYFNGHFSFKLNPKLANNNTIQSEVKVKKMLNSFLKSKNQEFANRAKKLDLKDFPILFNFKYLKLKSILPVYNKNEQLIVKWKALHNFELEIYDSNRNKDNKTTLETDSIILEISGDQFTRFHYLHTPISQRRKVLIIPDSNSEFIYKKVNLNTIAPYYLTSRGHIPACKDSISILTQPFGFSNTFIEKNEKKDSMLTLSNVIHPKNGEPGSAKITIFMRYKLITEGEGAVENLDVIDQKEFERLYKLGNPPGIKYKEALKVKSLPTPNSICFPLSHKEKKLAKKIDQTTGKALFNNYYNLSIEYDFKLEKKLGITLYEGVKWITESPENRGIMYLTPFLEFAEKDYLIKNVYTIKDIKNELDEEDRASCTELDLQEILDYKISTELTNKLNEKSAVYFIKEAISNNLSKYVNSNLYLENSALKGFDLIYNNFVVPPKNWTVG